MSNYGSQHSMGNPSQSKKKKKKSNYCILCRETVLPKERHQHLHSMAHHRELESLMGNVPCHDCQACQVSSLSLIQYAQHIANIQHQANLRRLIFSNVKPITIYKTLDPETIKALLSRNKTLKKQRKKMLKKQNKKKNQQPNTSKQVMAPQQEGSHTTVFIEKDNQPAYQKVAAKSNGSQHDNQTCGESQLFSWPGNDPFGNYQTMSQSDSAVDFASDHVPSNHGLIFHQDECVKSSVPEQNQTASNSQPKPVPNPNMDVSTMLRDIRQALGVREPCRADREARKQNAQVGARPSERCSSQDKATPQKSMTLEPNPSAPSTSRASSVPISSKAKVRIAHKAAAAQRLGQQSQNKMAPKVGALSFPNFNQKWKTMYDKLKKSKQKQKKKESTSRFGIELVKPLHKQNPFEMGVADDLMLSEGFHWESLSDTSMPIPLLPALPTYSPPTAPIPPITQDTTVRAVVTQSKEHMPLTLNKSCGPTRAGTVNVDPEEGNRGTNKRKYQQLQEDGSPVNEAFVKRNKTMINRDRGQMDKLLSVSLREEELCQSVQEVDKSLVLARKALQVAFAEVQRLTLLRQQYTAEVDSLRAHRIEILQGMQEVYSGSSNEVQAATTSSSASTDRITRSPSSRSSSKVIVSAPNIYHTSASAPSISQPQTASIASTIIANKQEAVILSTSKQPSSQAQMVSSPLPSRPTVASPTVATNEQTRADVLNPSLPANSTKMEPESFLKENVNIVGADDESTDHSTGLLNVNHSAAIVCDNKGNESDDLVEVMEPKMVVITIDESENEESPKKSSIVAGPQQVPLESISMKCVPSSTQPTLQMKTESPVLSESDPSPLQEVVEVISGEDEPPALGAFSNHTGAVHDLQIHEGFLYTCSADNTARAYSLTSKECQGVFEGHTNKINCLLVSCLPNMPARLFTGSSDQTVRIYSLKTWKCLETITLPDRVLCLHIAWNTVFVGLASGSVATFDLKTLKPLDMFECHGPRGISCLGTAQEGARRVLLVGSYDSTISVRDAKSCLLLRSLKGHTKTVLCMKVVKDLVFSGSSDNSVHAHNIHTGELIRIYKGHSHAVTSIVILGKVMVTACLDQLVRVYELESHDRLQVYGGHSDMVMCMAVHKSVIYTGCHDGSIQGVKLNLMKNYRCWWQNCCLIFGMAEHLVQHLVGDHTSPNLETVKCRWRGCSTFFPTQQTVRQELPKHMQNHVDVDSKVES
ncbi:zinc finger protein 106-like [Corythoichthys intestinalis]|uniref:zinc finger protein 106-like n=1 Tax=Corythoichthys intestinalis TaxID=161448 RepID=UPI0025A535F3|nr:zinc finger protein 106-like [Corythoichthys intestinalis]XP_057678629.1 zinc finger protein 106-like [Corythoichthys intestinalis]